MVNIVKIKSSMKDIYWYQTRFLHPAMYSVDFDIWEKSFLHDIDGKGKTLFKELTVKGAYLENELVGFVQYGRTSLGFDKDGKISERISYPVIRSLYFNRDLQEVGAALLNEALKDFGDDSEIIYAFYHYFGMSCYARHGKLFENCSHISTLLLQLGFQIEHENVFYSSVPEAAHDEGVAMRWHEVSTGRQQYGEFLIDSNPIGECEIHYLEQPGIAYLRWIYVKEGLQGNGIGAMCMCSLKNFLYKKGIRKLDTDTALTNVGAQHFYEKNGFARKGISRSFYLEND